jgi:FkbM family methyltransferase
MPVDKFFNALVFPVSYVKARAKDVIRGMIPPHIRLVREGKAFLADGEREVHLLHKLVERGTTAIDVGANVGGYTYALCHEVGTAGRVISIEPIADLARMLERATRRLSLPVTVINCALSSKEGTASLFIPIVNGRRRIGFATLENRDSRGKTYTVPLKRLDDICKDVSGKISFIKIDVEGHELSVLQGATETLRRHRPNLLIEIEQRHSPIPIGRTLAWITDAGYRGEFLDSNGSPCPLSEFDVNTHQTSQLDHVGQPGYVSNFIFRPVS